MMNALQQEAFRPAIRVGDKVVGVSSTNMLIDPSYRTVRLTSDDDCYVDFAPDPSANAVVGSGIKLRGGAIETFKLADNWRYLAYVAAVATSMNITFGEGD